MNVFKTMEDIQIDREDVILLLIDANRRVLLKPSLGGATRLEKLVFLLQQETDFEGIAEFYSFKPHNFGPFSQGVYEAVDFLESCSLLEVSESTFGSAFQESSEAALVTDPKAGFERIFRLTKDGQTVASKLREMINNKRPADITAIDTIVRKYGRMAVNQLIRYVYHQYPDQTVNSIHPEAAKVQHVDD